MEHRLAELPSTRSAFPRGPTNQLTTCAKTLVSIAPLPNLVMKSSMMSDNSLSPSSVRSLPPDLEREFPELDSGRTARSVAFLAQYTNRWRARIGSGRFGEI